MLSRGRQNSVLIASIIGSELAASFHSWYDANRLVIVVTLQELF